jgi:hypothetical protein
MSRQLTHTIATQPLDRAIQKKELDYPVKPDNDRKERTGKQIHIKGKFLDSGSSPE